MRYTVSERFPEEYPNDYIDNKIEYMQQEALRKAVPTIDNQGKFLIELRTNVGTQMVSIQPERYERWAEVIITIEEDKNDHRKVRS